MLDLRRVLPGLRLRPGVTPAALTSSEHLLKSTLPRDYVDFLCLTDGGSVKALIFWNRIFRDLRGTPRPCE